jgi:hypothetical protein
MSKIFAVVASLVLIVLGGCVQMPRLDLSSKTVAIREFTARDALDVLGIPRMANAATLEAKVAELRSGLLPDIAQAMDLIRAGQAQAAGATAKGVTVFVIDDFSAFRFNDGRYHGQYVSAIIKIVAPDATILTCDAWKSDLGECLFEANRIASEGKIQVVNMSLGILGTFCGFAPTSLEPPMLPDAEPPFEPTVSVTQDQAEALEHWVRDLQAKGVVVVSSAGNDGYRTGAKAPGCWSDLRVGAVYDEARQKVEWKACTDENVSADDRTCWSNYGNVFAPGAVIDKVFDNGISFNGTSASAPFTSGVTALVIGTRKIRGAEAAKRIIDTSVKIPDRFNTKLPHVRIDAVNATGTGAPPPPPLTLRGFLDKNKNCVLDDSEILTALSLWITQSEWKPGSRISDGEMISLLQDWIKQNNICKK